jgi:hypothetical protein
MKKLRKALKALNEWADLIIAGIAAVFLIFILVWGTATAMRERTAAVININYVPACTADDYSTVYPCYREGRPNDENGTSIWLGDE